MARGLVSSFAKKYGAVIFFPTVAISSIYADWSHTREWKRSLKAQQKK